MSSRDKFWKDLEELLREYNVAIICDNETGTYGTVGFQFSLGENVYTTRHHVTGHDVLDLAYKLERDNI